MHEEDNKEIEQIRQCPFYAYHKEGYPDEMPMDYLSPIHISEEDNGESVWSIVCSRCSCMGPIVFVSNKEKDYTIKGARLAWKAWNTR